MTVRAGYFENTVSFPVTATANAYPVTGAPSARHTFLVQSDRVIHVDRLAAAATPGSSLRIPANLPVLVQCFTDDKLSFILGSGETNGTVWFTRVDHA